MTVCANRFALLHLFVCLEGSTTSNQAADLIQLGKSREMVPRHRHWVKVATAVGARCRSFELVVPLDKTLPPRSHLRQPPISISRVVLAIVLAPAILAPRLAAIAFVPEMEVIDFLQNAAMPTSLHFPKVASVADRANALDMSHLART
jgi:hypothetical protein